MTYCIQFIIAFIMLMMGATPVLSFCNPVVQNIQVYNPRVTAYKDLYYMVELSGSDSQGNAYRIRVSDDLQNWGRVSYAFPTNSFPSYIGSVFENSQIFVVNDSSFRLYFAAFHWILDAYVIFVATASDIEGPYTVVNELIVNDPKAYASSPYVFDDSGQPYLVYDTDLETVNIIKLAKNGLSVIGEKKVIMQGNVWKPSMIKSESFYFLFFSDASTEGNQPNRGRVARSKTVTGPYELMDHNLDIGSSYFVDTVIGNVVKDENNTDTIFYNARVEGLYYGPSMVMAMTLTYGADGWPVVYYPPTTYC